MLCTLRLLAASVAVLMGLAASPANAQVPSPPSVSPGLTFSPIPAPIGGAVLTPSVTGNIPIGSGGASLQGTIQVPIVVPGGGPVQVTPPVGQLQLMIPIKR